VATGELINGAGVPTRMPKTIEVECTSRECELDMFELHYTYDMPDDTGVSDFACPYCGETDALEEIAV
jgi:predicted RNA-binding Zn-ribbon protein involved in translation (DUF1610 family)